MIPGPRHRAPLSATPVLNPDCPCLSRRSSAANDSAGQLEEASRDVGFILTLDSAELMFPIGDVDTLKVTRACVHRGRDSAALRNCGETGMDRRVGTSGFSLAELLTVVAIIGIVSAMAIPMAVREVEDYRLHSDATSVSSWLNVARLKAASQFAPYRLNVYVSAGSYILEQLCGTNASDASCTGSGATPYTAYSSALYDNSGTQYLSNGDTFSSCRPSAVTVFPGAITADPSSCPDPLRLYFNTRGAPVDSSGNPLANGGAVIYVRNASQLLDAVVVTLRGQVTVWTYSPVNGRWSLR